MQIYEGMLAFCSSLSVRALACPHSYPIILEWFAKLSWTNQGQYWYRFDALREARTVEPERGRGWLKC
jgi:hypothetical protein